jgi:hypothetical protein
LERSATRPRRFPSAPLEHAIAGHGLLVVAVLVIVGGMGLVGPAWSAAYQTQLARLVETSVTAVSIFIAVVAADELIERGAPSTFTYTVAIVLAALIGAVAGWHLRSAVGMTFAGPRSGGVAGPHLNDAHRVAHQLGIAIVCALVGGLATFVLVSRRTALAARQRQQEAERARALAQRKTAGVAAAGPAGARRADVPVRHARTHSRGISGRCRGRQRHDGRPHPLSARGAAPSSGSRRRRSRRSCAWCARGWTSSDGERRNGASIWTPRNP